MQLDNSLDRRRKALWIPGVFIPGTFWTENPPIQRIGGFSMFQEIECLTNNVLL
ncbi:MAG: hypothetical protein STSR0007_09640 [Thermovirga sp.]